MKNIKIKYQKKAGRLQKQIRLLLLSLIIVSAFSTSAVSLAQDATGAAPAPTTETSTETVATATKDTTVPSDVDEATATPGDSEVLVQWKAATDNVAVVGYKVHRGTESLTETNPKYNLPSIPVGNVTQYRVKDMTNDQVYYFSVSAIDAAGNESEYYSPEASATPKTGLHLASIEDDGKAPQINDVSSEDIITVTVEFSEPVKLPEQNPESAFVIETSEDKARLAVQRAEVDSRDETGKTIVLTTAPQKDGTEYVLTAGIEVKDYFNNPVISGTSDTGSFKGSDKENASSGTTGGTTGGGDASDTQPPVITSAIADFANRISVTFSEPVVLPANAERNIHIIAADKSALEVKNLSLSTDGATLYITTAPMQAVEYDIEITGITDTNKNESAEALKTTVTGKSDGLRDTTPPENVSDLLAKIKNAPKGILELRWKESANTAGDLADQLIYQSAGKNSSNFGHGSSLGGQTKVAEVQDLQPGWYTFKITAKDTSGNESSGAIISKYLPQSGPGMIAAGLTSVLMGLYRKKKKGRGVEGQK